MGMVGALVKSTSHAGRLQEPDPFFGNGIRRALRSECGRGCAPGRTLCCGGRIPTRGNVLQGGTGARRLYLALNGHDRKALA